MVNGQMHFISLHILCLRSGTVLSYHKLSEQISGQHAYIFSAFSPAKTQQRATVCNNVKCCMLYCGKLSSFDHCLRQNYQFSDDVTFSFKSNWLIL